MGAACVPHWSWLGCPELLPGEGQQDFPAPLASPGSLLRLVTRYDGPVTPGLAPAPVALALFILAVWQRLLQGQPVPCRDPCLAAGVG